jgi:hypothetical protein
MDGAGQAPPPYTPPPEDRLAEEVWAEPAWRAQYHQVAREPEMEPNSQWPRTVERTREVGNQPGLEPAMPKHHRRWQDEETARACPGCNRLFKKSSEMHHCRRCGGIFCFKCCGRKTNLSWNAAPKKLRVCDGCHVHCERKRGYVHPDVPPPPSGAAVRRPVPTPSPPEPQRQPPRTSSVPEVTPEPARPYISQPAEATIFERSTGAAGFELESTLLDAGPLRVGVLLGEYMLTKYLGQGSFATVWAAHNHSSGEKVALKEMQRKKLSAHNLETGESNGILTHTHLAYSAVRPSQVSHTIAIGGSMCPRVCADGKLCLSGLDQEILILRKLSHPHIVGLLDVIKTEHSLVLVLELCDRGDLWECVHRQN